jgi:hypothetical protein
MEYSRRLQRFESAIAVLKWAAMVGKVAIAMIAIAAWCNEVRYYFTHPADPASSIHLAIVLSFIAIIVAALLWMFLERQQERYQALSTAWWEFENAQGEPIDVLIRLLENRNVQDDDILAFARALTKNPTRRRAVLLALEQHRPKLVEKRATLHVPPRKI